jgi:hypothetical protein
VLIVGGLLAVYDFSGFRHLYSVGSVEGAAAGWGWSLAVSWLTAALEAPADDNLVNRISQFGGRALAWLMRSNGQGRRPTLAEIPTVRWYLLAVFSMLGAMEATQQGVQGALGFLGGAGAFAILFAGAELSLFLTQNITTPRQALAAQPI